MSSKERPTAPTSAPPRSSAANSALLHQAQGLLQQRKREEAALLYRRVLKTEPANFLALFNLGKICHEQRDLEGAAQCFEKFLKHKPGEAQVQVALAFVKLDRQDMDGALKLWNEVRGHVSSAKLLVKFGTHLRIMGRLAEAESFFGEAIAAEPDYIPAYQALALLKKLPLDGTHVSRMLALEKKGGNLPLDDRVTLGFTLGNIFLDQGDGDSAFPRLAEANRLKRAGVKYDIAVFERYIDNVISLFDKAFADSLRSMGSGRDERPVFVVGMMRSGSTLTDQILSSHPAVASMGETDYFPQSLPVFANAEIPGLFPSGITSITKPFLDSLSPATLDAIARKYLALTEPFAGNASRVVDKMLFNYLWVGMMRFALPAARLVHCTRDPVDVGLSIWRIPFIENIPWAYDMQEIGRYYRLHTKLMNHWKELFPGWAFEANYETMVENQEAASRRLLEHCGLPWNDICLKFHENTRKVNTASATQVRQPLYTASSGKWRKYQKHLGPLIDAIHAGQKT